MKNLKFALFLLIPLTVFSCKSKSTVPAGASQGQLDQCNRQVDRLNNQLASFENQMSALRDEQNNLLVEKNDLSNQLSATQASLEELQKASDDFGVWFRVQIGAYGDRRIDKSLETTKDLSLEERDELQKIVLGRFRNYDNAKELQKHLQTTGLKDAWVVSYKDGKRVSIDEALKN